ncbi:MAG: diaminopimelate decarboxylase [Clostridia bacterium]|nr:diaminopimelate decarboxylase [Clostridia bacterium]
MFIHDNLKMNSNGNLSFDGMDLCLLAKEYGTPAYIFSEDKITSVCRIYRSAMEKCYGKDGYDVLYASKAFSAKEIYRIMKKENMGIDVVSVGEIYTAASAGFDMSRAYFHGNNKTPQNIEYAMKTGVGCFVADNLYEIENIEKCAEKCGVTQKVILRVSPGIDAHTFKAVNTGKVDSKFGVAIATGQAMEAVKYILSMPHIDFAGLHCHIGSQIFDHKPFCDAAKIMTEFIFEIKKECGVCVRELNLGGGFGARYVKDDPVPDYENMICKVAEAVKTNCKAYGIAVPKVLIEPGRSIVAEAGLTLYTVGSIKNITGYKSYVAIDGGMPDNPRYALYGSKYTALLCNDNKACAKADFVCTIAGCCCESGDLIAEDIAIAEPKSGDIMAILSTGAYNYSMASNYNKVARLPVIMIKDGKSRIAVSRESLEDMAKNDI